MIVTNAVRWSALTGADNFWYILGCIEPKMQLETLDGQHEALAAGQKQTRRNMTRRRTVCYQFLTMDLIRWLSDD